TFGVTLSNPTNAALAKARAVGTIVDDDGGPSLSILDVTVAEGNSGTTNAVFTVSLSQASGQPVTVVAQTANGTATAGSDYTAGAPTTLTSPPGTIPQSFSVPVQGDTTAEPNETFTVTLSSPSNATISRAQATGTIENDDLAAAATSLSIADVSVTEGNGGT